MGIYELYSWQQEIDQKTVTILIYRQGTKFYDDRHIF